MIGQTLAGRYRITREIARGGMGIVFAAEQLGLQREVAVKALDVNAADHSWIERFETEAKVLAKLRHPNTLSVFDYGRMDDGTPYLVTELLHGKALSERLKSGRLPEQEVLDIMRDVAAALGEAHSLGIVHRDLKPGNIIVDNVQGARVVKVLDFGLAKRIDTDALSTSQTSGARTQAGTLLGTPAYISPEQARGEPVTPQSDLYALGATAFHLLTGKLPFEGDPLEQVLKHGTEEMPSFASRGASGLRPEVEALVAGLMAKDPNSRPADAEALMQSIDALAEERAVKTRTVISRPLLAATGLALCTSGLVLAVFVLQQKPTEIPTHSEYVSDAGLAPPPPPVVAGEPAETVFEHHDRRIEIAKHERWLKPEDMYRVVAQLAPTLALCHKQSAAPGLKLRFELEQRGRAVVVEPPHDKFRYCLVSKLPPEVKWPVRTGTAWVDIRIDSDEPL